MIQTKMPYPIKKQLEPQQNEKLIQLGINPLYASQSLSKCIDGVVVSEPIFTFMDLLQIVPPKIEMDNKGYDLVINFRDNTVRYISMDGSDQKAFWGVHIIEYW